MSALLLSTLGVVCPTCDRYNAPQSTKCIDCAASLIPAAPATARSVPLPAAAPAPRAAPPASITANRSAPPPQPPPQPPQPPRPTEPASAPSGAAPTAPKPEGFPPGMRPASRPAAPSQAPIPASELVKKPAARPLTATPSRFGITVVAGHASGQRFRLGGAGCMVGRSRGAILFADDPFVAGHHATLILRDGRLFVRDEGSASGVYVSLSSSAPEPLSAGGYFAAGGRCFRYVGPLARPMLATSGLPEIYGAPVPHGQVLYGVEEIIVGGRAGRAVITSGPLLTIGQSNCDLSFANDPWLAPRHCEVSASPEGASLRDLSGGMGTFIRLLPGSERPLNAGDRVRMGHQVMQVELVG